MDDLGFWTHAQQNPSHLAVVEPSGRQITAGELVGAANQIVHGLRALGLDKGDCVAIALPNSVEILEVFMAVAQAGWYVAPLNWHLTASEIAYILQDCGAKAFVASARFAATSRGAADSIDFARVVRLKLLRS
jgi:long-chain acyl-CoA synthetase